MTTRWSLSRSPSACAGPGTKDLPLQDLVQAVEAAVDGQVVVAPNPLGPMLARMREPAGAGPGLTAREHDVLLLLAEGHGVDSIATSLDITRNTTRKHVQATLTKLGADTQLEAVAIARREGLLAP